MSKKEKQSAIIMTDGKREIERFARRHNQRNDASRDEPSSGL